MLKMAILSNLLVLPRRFDFSESYLTAVLAPGLPSWKGAVERKREREKKEKMLQFAIHTHWGKMFNAIAVIHLSSLIKEKTLPFSSLLSRHLFDELSSGVIESVN